MTKENFQPNILCEHFNTVQTRIEMACLSSHRNRETITLIAVSKTRTALEIESIFQLDQRHFAENYVQEGLDKIKILSHLPITWHFIGKIQSNKTAFIAENFDWVHSLDSIVHLSRLNKQRPPHKKKLQICLQVNLDEEPQKGGLKIEEVWPFICESLAFENIELRGLMCIPMENLTPQETLMRFTRLKSLQEEINQKQLKKALKLQLDTLSMGMSDDLEQAIEAGSTMVRVGSALFGKRA